MQDRDDRALTPMPVTYQGRVMRSKLEGKWACFLDALRLRWDYEAEWFSLLGHGYAPDFRLIDYPRTWAEVKPDGITIDESQYREFARRGERLLLIVGSPWPDEYRVTLFVGDRREEGLLFALGRANSGEVWLMREHPDLFAVPLPSYVTRGEEWPLIHCRRLRDAYAHATGFQFWTPPK